MKLLLWYWGRRGHPPMALGLAKAFAEREDVDLSLSLSRQTDLYEAFKALETEPGVPVHWVKTYRSKGEFLCSLFRLPLVRWAFARFLSRIRPDVVFCSMTHLWNPALLGAVRKSGAAYVLLVHDAELHPGEQSGLRDRILTDEIVKADGLVTMSRHVRETLIRRHGLDANRIALVPHGVDLPDPDDALARTLPDLTKRPFQLLFFGRIVAYKGVDLLLEAYRLLLERGKAVELTIAGSGQADALIESARELSGITWDVRWIAEEEIGGLVSASDLVVLPYREASQSGIAPLAATRGVPSVATPVGGLVEQVLDGTTGLLSCEVSAEAFADAICALMEDPGLYARCSQGALDHAQTTLSWAAVAGQLAPFFAQIRQSRSAHPAE